MSQRQLTKSVTNRRVSGVIAGIAEYFGLGRDVVTILRILFVVLAFGSWGGLIPLYFVASWIIPSARPRNYYDDSEDDYQEKWNRKAQHFDEKMDRWSERYSDKMNNWARRYEDKGRQNQQDSNQWGNPWDEPKSRKTKEVHPHLKEVLFTREQIAERVKELAEVVSRDYEGKNPLVVGILKGSIMFTVDLLKELSIDAEVDFMDVTSYGYGISSSGEVRILKDLSTVAHGRDILIVEDIIDTGNTLLYLKKLLTGRQAHSVKIISLLDKPSGRKVDIDADYVGFEVPDAFIVGYGIDYAERYRQLPYIGIFNEEFLIKD